MVRLDFPSDTTLYDDETFRGRTCHDVLSYEFAFLLWTILALIHVDPLLVVNHMFLLL
jgi:hypothetical protein